MKTHARATLGATIVLLAALVAPALAHHSHAMFDLTIEMSVTGTVNAVHFANPHVFYRVDVTDENGETVTWSFEGHTVAAQIDRGLGPDVIRPGDVITVTFNPLRNGSPGGSYNTITTADGKTYN